MASIDAGGLVEKKIGPKKMGLENGVWSEKKVLRARRTRGPKMAKNPNFRNSIRHAQNVRLVLISIAQYPIIPKRPFSAKISRGYIFGEFLGPGPSLLSPLGGLFV